MKAGLALPLFALVAACSDAHDDSKSAPASAADVSFPCDVTKSSCQKALFFATAQTRGQDDAKLPPVRVITRKQLATELRAGADQSAAELDAADAKQKEQEQRGLSLLGLLPEPSQQSADDAYVEQSAASIAAYYSDESKDVTVIADQTMDPDDAMITLCHEFVHALQDQREHLPPLRDKYVQSTDNDIALTSLIEGEADWLAYATYFDRVKGVGVEHINYSKLFGSILDGTLHAIEESSAPLIDMSSLLPYPVGGRYVAELDVDRGLGSVSALYDDPPLALRSWVENPPDDLPAALDCDVAKAPDGYARIDGDQLGFGGLLAFRIAQGEAGMTAYNAALHWRTDKIVSYAATADDEAVAITWRVLLDDDQAAANLVALNQDAPGIEAKAQGSAVVISAATDPDLLASWRPSEGCPALDKRRGAETSGLLTRLKRDLGITR